MFVEVKDEADDIEYYSHPGSLTDDSRAASASTYGEMCQGNKGRFSKQFFDEELKDKLMEGIPKKTKYNNNWSVNIWREWARQRNKLPETAQEKYQKVPEKLEKVTFAELEFWLSRFIVEVRKKDGTLYPSRTLEGIISGIQRHMRDELGRREMNIWSKDNPAFETFRMDMDVRRRELNSVSSGAPIDTSPSMVAAYRSETVDTHRGETVNKNKRAPQSSNLTPDSLNETLAPPLSPQQKKRKHLHTIIQSHTTEQQISPSATKETEYFFAHQPGSSHSFRQPQIPKSPSTCLPRQEQYSTTFNNQPESLISLSSDTNAASLAENCQTGRVVNNTNSSRATRSELTREDEITNNLSRTSLQNQLLTTPEQIHSQVISSTSTDDNDLIISIPTEKNGQTVLNINVPDSVNCVVIRRRKKIVAVNYLHD